MQAAPGFLRLVDGAGHSITLTGDRTGRLLISAGEQSQELGLPTLAAFTAPTTADDATRQSTLWSPRKLRSMAFTCAAPLRP